MGFSKLTNKAIEVSLGVRFRALRLRKNITQQELAESMTLSLNTVKALESGNGKLSTVIAVLRALGALDQLENFIPDVSISTLQLVNTKGKQRERATGKRRKP